MVDVKVFQYFNQVSSTGAGSSSVLPTGTSSVPRLHLVVPIPLLLTLCVQVGGDCQPEAAREAALAGLWKGESVRAESGGGRSWGGYAEDPLRLWVLEFPF